MLNLFKNGKGSLSISKKVLYAVVLVSTFATSVTSLLQLTYEYVLAKESQTADISVFEKTVSAGLSNALWSFNVNAINDQLESSLLNEFFISLKVVDETNKIIAEKSKQSSFRAVKSLNFVLMSPKNESEKIGHVELTYTNDYIHEKVLKNAVSIVLLNFFKTLLVTALLFNIFYHLIVRRLNLISVHLKQQTFGESEERIPISKSKPFSGLNDEITTIENSINRACEIIWKNTLTLKESALSSARLAELGIFAGGIAHEINNPLAIISSTASILNRQVNSPEPLDAEQMRKHLGRISKASERIQLIVGSIRTLSRDGKEDPFVEHSVRDLVFETMSLCENNLKDRGIDFRFSVAPENLALNCRSVQLSQVLLNLINNARDAIAELPERWIEVKFFLQNDGSHVICTVTDSGSGISDLIQNKIFVPFYTSKPVGQGTGLGLAIVQSMVEQHGGKIQLNTECKNTQFVLSFPRDKEQKGAA